MVMGLKPLGGIAPAEEVGPANLDLMLVGELDEGEICICGVDTPVKGGGGWG